jgi:hypothetical protein
MNFERSRECNCDKVNNDKTLLKYSNSCISTKEIQNKEIPMNIEKSRKCNCVKLKHSKTHFNERNPS